MQRRTYLCLMLGALALPLGGRWSLATQLRTADAEDARQILLRERLYSAALLSGNVRLLASVLSESFVDTSAAGLLRDKRTFLKVIARQTPPRLIKESGRRIQVYDNTAVVTVRFEVQGLSRGKPYTFVGRATDVWVRSDGEWYCVAAHSSATS